MRLRQVDSLMVRDDAAHLDSAKNFRTLDFQYSQPNPTIVHQNRLSRLDRFGQIIRGDRNNRVSPEHIAARERHRLALKQRKTAPAEPADPDFRTLNVLEDSNWLVERFGGAAQGVNPTAMVLVRAMGKIQPGDIHPPPDHLREQVSRFGRGTKGANDFCFTHHFERRNPAAIGRWLDTLLALGIRKRVPETTALLH